MTQWIANNKKLLILGIAIIFILVGLSYLFVPTFKSTLKENASLKTEVTTLQQKNNQIEQEYSKYKQDYSEDTVKIIEPTILPAGTLAVDGRGNAVYKTSIVHKKNVVVDNESSKQTIKQLETQLANTKQELETAKSQTITKRETKRVLGLATTPQFDQVGVYGEFQAFGPLWTGGDFIVEDIKSGFDLKNFKMFIHAGLGF